MHTIVELNPRILENFQNSNKKNFFNEKRPSLKVYIPPRIDTFSLGLTILLQGKTYKKGMESRGFFGAHRSQMMIYNYG